MSASQSIIDPHMEDAIHSSVIAIQEAGFFAAGTMKNHKLRSFNRCGVLYFGNIMFADLNKETLCSIFGSIADKDIVSMNNLVLGMALSGNLPNTITERVLLIKERFVVSWDRMLFSRLMESPTYEEVFASRVPGEPLGRGAMDILLYSPAIDVKDSGLNEVLNKYLVGLSTEKTYTFGSRMNVLRKNQIIINDVFPNAHLDNIDLEFAIQATVNKSTEECNWLKRIFYHICINAEIDHVLTERISYIHDLYGDLPIENAQDRSFLALLKHSYLYRAFMKNRCNTNCLYIPEIDDDDIYEIFKSFVMQSSESSLSWRHMADAFGCSLEVAGIHTINDINLSTFERQVKFYRSRFEDKEVISHLCHLYLFALNNYDSRLFNSDGISAQVFAKAGLGGLLFDGYKIICYNQITDVPSDDKWILCFDSKNESNIASTYRESVVIDFTEIQNETFRYWYKFFVWKNTNSIYSKVHTKSIIFTFFSYIDDLKHGRQLSIYVKPNNDETISVNEIIAYKAFVNASKTNNRTVCGYTYNPRNVLNFVKNNGIADIPNAVFYYLKNTLNSDYDNTEAIPDGDLGKLAKVIDAEAKKNNLAAIYQVIFYLALETEFRASQILSLRIDCVYETAKKNQYVLVSKTKTSANEPVEQPITIYAKRHIDEVIRLTKEYRHECQIEGIRDLLFIAPMKNRKGIYSTIRAAAMNNFLSVCCDKAEIKRYSMANLRDTHMTKAEEYVIRKNLSDIDQNILSGHRSPNVDTKHYVDNEIRNMLESVHGVIIGDVDIKGQIYKTLPSDIATNENSVANRCGYCSQKSCTDLSYLDCLMCKDFVTTPDRLPYFKERIKSLDEKILNASIPHDKEDLVAVKRLHVGFIEALLNLKEGEN